MSNDQMFFGGGLPVGSAVPFVATFAGRSKGNGNEEYQQFPGSLLAIADALDQAFADKYPHLAAIAVAANTLTTTNTNSPVHFNCGKVGSNYVGLYSGAVAAGTDNVGFRSTSSALSSPTALTNATVGNATDPIVDVLFTPSGNVLVTYSNATNSAIRRSTDGSAYSTAMNLNAALAYKLASNAAGTLHTAVNTTAGTAGGVFTSTTETAWTTRTPTGFTGGGQVYHDFWCPQANGGSGAFVYLGSARAWTTTDGWNQLATNAAHGITVDTGNAISQVRAASSATATVVCSASGIWRTTDGLAYTKASGDAVLSVWIDGTTFYGITASGAVLSSTDDGVSWALRKGVIHDTTNGEQTNGKSKVYGARLLSADNLVAFGFGSNIATPLINGAGTVAKALTAGHIGQYRNAAAASTVTQCVRVK